jgi:hypothetical protein
VSARRRLRRQRRSALVPGVCSGLALSAWCGFASGFHRSTPGALWTWVVSLCLVVGADLLLASGRRGLGPWRARPARDLWPVPGPDRRRRALAGVSPWIGLVLVALAWDVLGLDTGPDRPHLTISALSQAFRPLDAALLLVWTLVGLGYGLVRARAPGPDPVPGPSQAAPAAPSKGGAPALVPGLLLPPSRPAGVAFWLGVVALGLVLEASARRSGGRIATAEQFLRLLSGPPLARLALVVAWGYAGWHLFAY